MSLRDKICVCINVSTRILSLSGQKMLILNRHYKDLKFKNSIVNPKSKIVNFLSLFFVLYFKLYINFCSFVYFGVDVDIAVE